MKYVIKRDGRRKVFDKSKIEKAILSAFMDVDGEITEYAQEKAKNIADYIENVPCDHDMGIEEIQDLVEKGLMSCKRKDVAKSYILYREERSRIRSMKSSLMGIIKEKLDASNVVNQNANIDERSFGGRRGEATNEMMKQYALDYCMTEKSRENHLNNEIYIHDLDSYAIGMHNCLTIPFDKLLAEGFNTRQTDVRPASSVNTAFQLVAVIFQLQSLQQFGGVSASHLDWTMVPYVRKSFRKHYKDGMWYLKHPMPNKEKSDALVDVWGPASDMSIDNELYKYYPEVYEYALDMTQRELDQAVEGLYHNLNTLQSRSGN